MRETTKNRILCLLFGGFLLVMGALFLFAPKEDFDFVREFIISHVSPLANVKEEA